MKRSPALLALLPLTLATSTALADLPADGQRIRTNDYAIDLSQTPVLAGTRVSGLGGAFVAIGEGIDGIAQNPGGVALRMPWSVSHLDLELGLGITFSSSLAQSDVFNSGHRTVVSPTGAEALTFLSLAAHLELGRWGFGLSTDLQEYSLDRSTTPNPAAQRDRLVARFAVNHATVGYAFEDNEILLGIGARWTALNVVNSNAPGGTSNLFAALGSGAELGVLFRPNEQNYRIGLCLRTPVSAGAAANQNPRIVYPGDSLNELYLPDRVVLPWELNVGFALQLGRRPLNPRWFDPDAEFEPVRRYLAWRERERWRQRALSHRPGLESNEEEQAIELELETEATLDALYLERAERELVHSLRQRSRDMQRSHVLLTASFDVLGPVNQAVGVESFLQRSVQRSGTRVNVSPHLGVETEAIPDWMRARIGTYLEPTRFDDNPKGARAHFTIGLDQRLFRWEVFGLWAEGSTWMVSGSLDVAREYFSWGLAIGMWH